MTKNAIGSVLVVGGGIAGMQSALDLANSGYYVYLLEKEAAIGGVMAQLDKTFPTNDCAMCIMSPILVEVGRHVNIEMITYADLEQVDGGPGDFTVTINKRARLYRHRFVHRLRGLCPGLSGGIARCVQSGVDQP